MNERAIRLWRETASGQRRGASAAALRGALWAASLPYAAVTWRRNRRYDRGKLPIVQVGAPVLCIGNLTVGGVGKTPMVRWTARLLRGWGYRVGIVSRGYGAEAGSRNDEALELELDLPDVPHLQNVDRAAAAQVAIEELGMEAIVLDDGFQHRRLARDLDVVLLDASAPFGYGHQLPRGLLRESPRGLQRAGAVVLTRADMLDAAQRAALAEQVRRLAPEAAWAETTHRPVALVDAGGRSSDLAALRGARIAAFCGLGNPSGFRHTLAQAGADVALWREFADHHHYTREDVEALTQAIAATQVELAVCTRKDLVKLQISRLGATPLRAVAIELEFQCGQDAIEQRIRQALPPPSDDVEMLSAADTPESY